MSTDTSVPQYPNIRTDGITPAGLGNIKGNKPCFCTEANRCLLYIPHSLTENQSVARSIFTQIMPIIDDMWPNCGDRTATVMIDGGKWNLFLEFVFSHILIQRAR